MPAPPQNRSIGLSPLGELLFGCAFCLPGLALIAVAIDWVPVSARSLEAPRWLIAAAGVMFVACGFVPAANRQGPNGWQGRLTGGIAFLSILVARIVRWLRRG